MLFRHKRTGQLYRMLFPSFSVERQRHSVVYVGLEGGQIFDRDAEKFSESFEFVNSPQEALAPHAPHA